MSIEKIPAIQGYIKDVEQQLEGVTVTTQEELATASAFRMQVAERYKKVETLRKAAVEPHNKIVKEYNAAFKNELDKLDRIKRGIDAKIDQFIKVEELRALEAQRKADEARKQAEAEAAKEAERLRAEARAKEEAAQNASAEEAAKLRAEAAAAEEQAQEEVFAAALQAMPAEQAQTTVRTEHGTVSRKLVWDYEITDEEAFVRQRPDLCTPDPKKIRAWIMETKVAVDSEGIRVFQKGQISGR